MEMSTILSTNGFKAASTMLDVNTARPTKLFIGGITRHTTTKQLRDHFSQYGRVLDCVAMRQPDGRPRGFGYVTLDSAVAAERCLQEPQVVDGRVVDLKLAVPEGNAGVKENYGTVYPGASLACTPWWPTDPLQKPGATGLDCVDLLSRHSHWSTVPAQDPLNSMAFRMSIPHAGMAKQAELSKDRSLAPATLSPNAPEFVPKLNQVPVMTSTCMSPVSQGCTRAPLGEITNIFAKDQSCLLKPLKVSYTDTTSGGFLSRLMHKDGLSDEEIRADSSLNDDVASCFSSMGDSSMEGESPAPRGGSNSSASGQEAPGAEIADLNVDTSDLPSIGSALHGKGECKRCNFFSKGRCQNGRNCTFCHFTHDKRKPSRQEKRERQAAWLATRAEEHRILGSTAQAMNMGTSEPFCKDSDVQAAQPEVRNAAHVTMLLQDEHVSLGSQPQQEAMSIVKPAVAPMDEFCKSNNLQLQDVDVSSEDGQQTIAYPVLPGLPPMKAMRLPSPLPLPHASGPLLPPGLPPPVGTTTPVWQPDEEASPACQLVLPQCSTMSANALATTPMSSSSALSHGIPVAIPDVAPKEMCTTGTQTSDEFVCAACAAKAQKTVAGATDDSLAKGAKTNKSKTRSDRTWPRDELLRLGSYCKQVDMPSFAFAPFQMATINV